MTDQLPVVSPWFARRRVDDSITLLWEPHVNALLQCNIWHVRGRDSDLLVDTGIGVASLAMAGADLFATDLLAVATHAHVDHVGGLHEFAARAIHAEEAATIAGITGTLQLDTAGADAASIAQVTGWGYDISGGLLEAVPREGFDLSGEPRHPAPATTVLAEGDVLDLGNRAFQVLHLPGHSKGSIGLWDADAGLLFSGDAVYDGPLLDEIEGADIAAYVETMRRLLALPVETVHGGHGNSMNRERLHAVIDGYLRSRRP